MLDSTNFDNHEFVEILTDEQRQQLQLDKVAPGEQVAFGVGYSLELSPQFQTWVFNYYPSEGELYTVLINYDDQFNIIDFEIIAYDEIFESFRKVASTIDYKLLEVKETDWRAGKARSTVTQYAISEEGEITAVRR